MPFYLPCLNPQCKSYGKSHPNCLCYGGKQGNQLAGGGEVEQYCSKDRPHLEGCEYYADGGGVDFVPDTPTPTTPPATSGSIDFQPDDQTAAAKEKYGNITGITRTAALGIAEGLAGPIGTALMKKAGVTPEEQEGLKKANPGTYYGTFGTSLVGPAMLGEEAGVAANLTQAGVVGKAARAATEFAGLEEVPAVAARMGIENALLAGSSELSKAVNGDPNTIQTALAHVGLSGLLGAGTGAAFGSVGNLWLSKLGPKVEEFAEGLQRGLNDVSEVPKPLPGVSGTVSEVAPEVEEAIKPTQGQKFADFIYKKASDAAAEGVSDIAGSIAGGLSGIPGGRYLGAYLGHYALKPLVKTIMPSLVKPILDMAPSGVGLRAAFDAVGSIAKGDALIDSAAKGVFQTGSKVLFDQLSPDQYKLDKLSNKVQALSQSPESMMGVGGAIGHYLPQHQMALASTAQNAVGYLEAQRPKPMQPGPIDKPIEPTQAGMSLYNRTLSIAEQPLSVLSRIKDGSLLPKDVQDIKTLYPALYTKLSQKLSESMINHISEGGHVSYKMRGALSTFLGSPIDSTFTQPSIMAAQATYMPTTPPTMPLGASKKKKGTSALGKSAEAAQTPQESRQKALSKA